MTDYYVRSTTGADVNSGLTWALAKATIGGLAGLVAGDRIFISQAHNEAPAGNAIYGQAPVNIDGNPIRYICANDATGEPPAAGSGMTTAVSTGVGASPTMNPGDWYGITFEISGGAINVTFSIAAQGNSLFTLCNFKLNATGASSKFSIGNPSTSGSKKFVNCNFKFSNNAQNIILIGTKFHWQGGAILAGSTTPTLPLFGTYTNGVGNNTLIEDVDFSNLGAALFFFTSIHQPSHTTVMRNCKLPAGWTGGPVQSPNFGLAGCRVSMYNCWNSAARYMRWIEDFAGTIRDETSIVRTGGNPTSIKMSSNAKCLALQPTLALKSDELVKFNTLVGAPITVSVQVLTDSATPTTNAQAWLEVEYLSAAGSPLGAHISDGLANHLDGPTTQDAGATWASGAMANPDARKLSVTFTPQRAGYVHAKVFWNKPSAILYLDEVLTIV